MINHIIFYGTFMNKCGARGHDHSEHLTYLRDVTFPGDMYDVHGGYPAVIMGEGRVHGELFRIDDRHCLTNCYDFVEGYGGHKDGDLYTRTVINIPGVGLAWIYTWNSDVDGMEKIESGDWTKRGHV